MGLFHPDFKRGIAQEYWTSVDFSDKENISDIPNTFEMTTWL